MKKILFFCIFLLFSTTTSFAKFDPSFTWTTLETPHFLIHYHQDGEQVAAKVANIAEDVHARLVPRIKWEPKQKTHVVLVDAMDEANGLTTVFPYNQMVLFLTQPLGEPGFGTTPFDDWMRLLVTHEYAHVLQLDMVYGGYGNVMRTLFGRSFLSFPNAIQPMWLIEGLATYEETAQTPGGRGRSAGADMVLRMAVLDEPFPSISDMTVFPDTWPSGQVPYLFGESFTRFIADKYGRDKLADLSLIYSKRGAPFLVNSTAQQAVGRYYGSLYREWKNSLRQKYEQQSEAVKSQGLTESHALTKKGYETLSPVYSPDGGRIAYFVSNNDEFPGLYIMNSDGSNDRKLVENLFPSSASGIRPAWSPDGQRIYYTKIEVTGNTNLCDDIYYYDLGRDKEVRLTKDLRGRDPDQSPDGQRLVFVANRMGMTRLAVLDLPAKKQPAEQKNITFLTDESANQYETPRWSPDGSRIAVAVWQPGGYKDVWILDRDGRKIDEVTHDRAIDGSSAWSSDGRYLYFSSDRTGIYNLYAYEMGTKKIFQITNVIGGAFSPAPSPDNKTLAYTSYSAKGYDIHIVPLDPAGWKSAVSFKDEYPAVQYEDRKIDASIKPYSPMSTICPRFWLPWFGYSHESGVLGGFLTLGQDVVQRHSYVATGLYGPRTSRFWYSLDYMYDGLYPTVRFHASDQDETYENLLEPPFGTEDDDYIEKRKIYGLEMIMPLIKSQKQHALSIGYQWEEASALSQIHSSAEKPFEGVLASGTAGYLFNNSKKYAFSISPEQGRTIRLGYERFDESLGGDLELNKYTADWHEYLSFPWSHQVLQIRGFAGGSTGRRIPQGAFQLGGDMPGDVTISVDDRHVYLRGYPQNEFRGQKVGLLSLEYRFPLVNIEHGGGQTPFYIRRLHGAVFAEAGNAWDEGTLHASDAKRAVGAEARLDMDLAYSLVPITLRLGFARGLDEQGESQLILNLWMPLGL